ncbi:MAG: NupC/NupG family nucleoside CNT transporter [Phycisphaerales bacterium]
MPSLTPLLGILTILAIGTLLSTARTRINWRLVASGVLLQFVIAFLLLRFDRVVGVFDLFAAGVTRVISFADAGIVFLFGNLADASKPWGFVFAIKVLPVIIFFASFMGVLYHVGIMQRVVAGVAWGLRRTMGITGVEALSAAANIFVGQTEAPLTVRPYLPTMTRSQLMAVMVGGFATIAGSVMAAYIGMLGGESEASRILFAKHLMTASVMSAPAGLVMGKLMLPETDTPRPETVRALMHDERTTANVLDAAAAGATDGLKLAANVAAMLVAFVALLAMVNWPIGALSEWGPIAAWREARGLPVFNLQTLLGYPLTPLAWLIGVPWADAPRVGALMGTGIIATEFVAYVDLARHVRDGTMSPRACQIAAYCLCGFANIPSIAIQIGGLSALAPTRRADLVSLAPRAMVAGALACWMTGACAALFIV